MMMMIVIILVIIILTVIKLNTSGSYEEKTVAMGGLGFVRQGEHGRLGFERQEVWKDWVL
jgi:hypothetical protein